jgi:hypothetical protein
LQDQIYDQIAIFYDPEITGYYTDDELNGCKGKHFYNSTYKKVGDVTSRRDRSKMNNTKDRQESEGVSQNAAETSRTETSVNSHRESRFAVLSAKGFLNDRVGNE